MKVKFFIYRSRLQDSSFKLVYIISRIGVRGSLNDEDREFKYTYNIPSNKLSSSSEPAKIFRLEATDVFRRLIEEFGLSMSYRACAVSAHMIGRFCVAFYRNCSTSYRGSITIEV